MAISLNSINSTLSSYGTRITNLENKVTNGYVTMVSLWTGTARNTTITVAALANYNVCWFKTSWGDCMCYKGGSTVIYDDADNGNIDRISISWSGTTVTTSTGNAWHNIALTQICGLKIYYIFRYNMVCEFLSKIKIKLIAFLEALLKKGGVERWLSV